MISMPRPLAARPARGRAQRAPARAAAAGGNDGRTKTVLITGGNSGIGFEAAKELGARGFHTILACRDETRGQDALAKLQVGNRAGSFELMLLQLDDLGNVRDFVKAMQDSGRQLDVLLNNAGVMACPEMATVDGFEYQLGVNHFGHFALTAGLLPLMSDPTRSTRVVTVSSTAQMFGDINLANINLRGQYSDWGAYGQSKLANAMFGMELANRLPYSSLVTSNTLHPGVVATELGRFLGGPLASLPGMELVKQIGARFLKTPEEGAQTSIYLAASEDVEGITGKYFMDCKPAVASPKVYDTSLRKALWDLSCELTGVDFDVERIVSAGTIDKPEESTRQVQDATVVLE